MKKIIFILTLAFSFFSCSEIVQEHNALKAEKSADKNTYLVITNADIEIPRTINPVITDDDIQGIINRLTDFQLKGTPPGYSDVMTIAKASSYEELLRLQVPLTAGDWRNVSLTADLDIGTTSSYKISFSETKSSNIVIKPGMVNPVSFSLKSSGKSGMSVTMNFTGDADRVKVSIKTATMGSIYYSSTAQRTFSDFTAKEIEGRTVKSFTYTRDRTNYQESLETGTYYLLFEFFKDGVEEPLNNPGYFIRVENGFVTTADLSVIDLNETYNIEYVYYIGSTPLPSSEGSLPDGISIAEDSSEPSLKQLYSRKSTITLPNLSKDDYTFDGWYTSTDFTEASRITVIPKGSTGRKILYARFLAE